MVTPAQLGLLLRCQRWREEAGAATQEKLSLQIQERELFLEAERKDLGILSFTPPGPLEQRAASHFLFRGPLSGWGNGPCGTGTQDAGSLREECAIRRGWQDLKTPQGLHPAPGLASLPPPTK